MVTIKKREEERVYIKEGRKEKVKLRSGGKKRRRRRRRRRVDERGGDFPYPNTSGAPDAGVFDNHSPIKNYATLFSKSATSRL